MPDIWDSIYERYPTYTVYDYDSNGNLLYRGKAPKGSSTAHGVWVIQKFASDAANRPSDGKYAPVFSIWDNRASLTYT